MNILGSVDSTPEPKPEYGRSRRRFWHWGIYLWLSIWILSLLLVESKFHANLKGIACMDLALESGCLKIDGAIDTGFSPNKLRISKPVYLWSRWDSLTKEPGDLWGIFGHIRFREDDGYRGFAVELPMAGLLWLWLIAAWTYGLKNSRWSESWGNKRMLARGAVLVLLPLFVLLVDHRWRVADQTRRCIMGIRNIQQALRSHNGMNSISPRAEIEMPWEEIFGPKKFLPIDCKKCPGGPSYRLLKHPPDIGELAAECPNPEHQRRMKMIDTSGW